VSFVHEALANIVGGWDHKAVVNEKEAVPLSAVVLEGKVFPEGHAEGVLVVSTDNPAAETVR
jgi:hypothetical protein